MKTKTNNRSRNQTGKKIDGKKINGKKIKPDITLKEKVEKIKEDNEDLIKILIVDDHPIIREGLRSTLNGYDGLYVIGEASTGAEAITCAAKLKPDIILLDISLPDMTGLSVTKKLCEKKPCPKIIALTMHDNKEYVFEITRLGAMGYVLKDSPPKELLHAIETVYKGNTYFSPHISQVLLNQYTEDIQANRKPFKENVLTKREYEVLFHLVNGLSNKLIADKLFVSVRTVETHRERIMKKLNIHTVAGLTKYAISEGIIELT